VQATLNIGSKTTAVPMSSRIFRINVKYVDRTHRE
jgi:hypothetical protein